jgi:hypothetical protein
VHMISKVTVMSCVTETKHMILTLHACGVNALQSRHLVSKL